MESFQDLFSSQTNIAMRWTQYLPGTKARQNRLSPENDNRTTSGDVINDGSSETEVEDGPAVSRHGSRLESHYSTTSSHSSHSEIYEVGDQGGRSVSSADEKGTHRVSIEKGPDGAQNDWTDSNSTIIGGTEALDFTAGDLGQTMNFKEKENPPPANTLRMWLMCIILGMVISAIDSFFAFRFPGINIKAIVAQLIAYPCGIIWHTIMPNWKIRFGKWYTFELNPGRFSPQEQALVFLFCNTCLATGLLRNAQVEQTRFFKIDIGIGRFILFDIVGYLLGWGMAGLSIPALVDREELVWPSVLGPAAMINALHSGTSTSLRGSWRDFKNPKFLFFVCAFFFAFIWYWVSDFFFPFLDGLGAFPSWCRPKNDVLGQIFGVKNGMGLLPISFDWPTISHIGNPLTTPVWAASCIFFSFFFWCWVVMPGLYYENHWQTAHLPFMSNKIFDFHGKSYNYTRVINDKWELDVEKYKKYSPVLIPIGFLIQIAITLAGFSSMMIFFFWRFKKDVWDAYRKLDSKKTFHYRPAYTWWFKIIYASSTIVGFGLGFLFVCGWNEETQLGPGGYVVSIAIGMSLFLPVAFVESKSSFALSMNGFYNVVGGTWYKGKPMATLYFLNLGFSMLQHAMHMTQGAKLGLYMNTPPRLTMFVLFCGGIWGALVCPSVVGYAMYHVKSVCTPKAHNHMTCKSQQTAFNTQVIWGLFGDHIFSHGGRYQFIQYFFLVGAGAAIIVIALQWWKPKNGVISKLNPTLLIAGAEDMPTSTGLYYGTYFLYTLVFNYFIHRKYEKWWRKYNLILAVALDCGVAIAAIIVFFAVSLPGGTEGYKWWATEVASTSCDAKGCPYRSPKHIKPPTSFW